MYPFVGAPSKPLSGVSDKKPATGRTYKPKRHSRSFYNPGIWSQPVAPGPLYRNVFINQSHVVSETVQHVVSVYGSTMPVHVTEALTMIERGVHVSVKLSESGWAWLVCGRKLLVWKYKEMSGIRNVALQCRELTLPPSDLAHKADLVCILANESQTLSVIAVSPEGIVRYWPNFAHNGNSVEVAADLQGQECYSLTSAQPLGYILGTTTGTLVLITASSSEGQHSVTCRTLKVPQGMLAGIGRRVSSFIFGAMPAQTCETKPLVKVLIEPGNCEEEKYLYVLSGCTLQKRELTNQGLERLLCEYDLDRPIRDSFLDALWSRENTHLHQIQTWAIDAQIMSKGILILMASLNKDVSPLLHFALGMVEIQDTGSAVSFSKFYVLQHTEQYRTEDEEQLLSCKLLIPKVNDHLVYVYNNCSVMCVSLSDTVEDIDVIEFRRMGDKILGSGVCENYPLFFSTKCGIVALMHSQNTRDDFSQASSILLTSDTSFVTTESKDEQKDKRSKLRTALLLFCQNEIMRSQAIITETFPATHIHEADSALDIAVATLSKDIIDEIPASDPRWAESIPSEMSMTSGSVILKHQLADKLKSHECLLNFLKACGLWDRLLAVTLHGKPMATLMLLREHAEKLVAALALRRLHMDYNDVLEAGVRKVLANRDENFENSSGLTAQDVFYRQVSSIEDIFPALLQNEQEQLRREIAPQDTVTIVSQVSHIYQEVLQEVYQYRQTKAMEFSNDEQEFGCMLWTSASGPGGIRTVLIDQCMLMEHAITLLEDVQNRGLLFQQLVHLVDIILEEYRYHLRSLQGNDTEYEIIQKDYHNSRKSLIGFFLDREQYERAAALAEKFCDFDTLVLLCEKLNDDERLHRYIQQFANTGFLQFAFNWYVEKGKRGKLLSQFSSYSEELNEFLKDHDTLQWLHQIHIKQYSDAHQTLQKLAQQEESHLSKKKTLISLSKLALLASDQPADIIQAEEENLDNEEQLILYQEALPPAVMEAFGLDPDTMHVLSPESLIELYISDENSNANEYDFKKALELLSYIKKPLHDQEVEALKLKIWCKAILRDDWDDMDTNLPLESIRETVFFRVLELASTLGVDMQDFLPPFDQLIQCSELSSIANSNALKFLLKAAYEYIYTEHLID